MTKSLLFSCFDCSSRSAGPLHDIPADLLTEFGQSRVTNIYKKGQTIFYEGNHPYGVYCINEGKVKLFKSTAEGKEYIVSILKTGDILGYKAFFNDNSYIATAQVLEDAVICFIDKAKFFNLLKKYPSFSIKLLEIMSKEINCSNHNSISLAYNSSNERIIELLLTLKESFGVQEDDGSIKINLLLSREDMANMIGTTIETTVRLITWLKEKEIIKIKNKYFFIKDINKLLEMLPEQ